MNNSSIVCEDWEIEPCRTILIVESHDLLRKLLERILTRAGQRWVTAQTQAEALNRFTEIEVYLVVTEWNLSDGTSAEMLEAMRNSRPELPVLIISTFRPTSLPLGCEFLRKPFRLAELVEWVDVRAR